MKYTQETKVRRDKNMIDFAIEMAVKAHRRQPRKHTDIPYITHPIGVALLLAQSGCSYELITAGLLHDTTEDMPIGLKDIRDQFGEFVASIGEGCSESDKSLPWEDRKKHTIEFLKTASLDIRIVACADKLNNIRTIACDYYEIGDKVWERFNRGKKKQGFISLH
jgi:(p)ppGpp synthase/HD superfamily hydrolase